MKAGEAANVVGAIPQKESFRAIACLPNRNGGAITLRYVASWLRHEGRKMPHIILSACWSPCCESARSEPTNRLSCGDQNQDNLPQWLPDKANPAIRKPISPLGHFSKCRGLCLQTPVNSARFLPAHDHTLPLKPNITFFQPHIPRPAEKFACLKLIRTFVQSHP